ncbi:YhgE/Pip domain-containing protein [Cohnella lubricantis]|uniref:YhgE/Pip domain-containing protein n=1 Tax=Cohnella lubricantis TaxID=2163172 RepID=A0A841T9M7_9BACL|nr:YhgE/Pip domain-containing protein [Cohnella lubricantis]MBB6676736.1 YhgE/Pip domain-containing protein [Cohnella lubricantis]MBP2117782.1 putative membrane protein [Cohnella lubricantis]
MRQKSLFRHDWHFILNHKQLRIAVAILLLVPVLYAGMFLSGYWNPYDKLDKLPVAVVNLDHGAAISGQQLDVGKDMVDELKRTNSFDYRFVNLEEADEGLETGEYYLSIVIPENFSANIASLNGDHPEQAQLIYKTNPGNNYVSGQIGSSALTKLKDEVSQNIIKTYTTTVMDSIRQLSDGFAQAGEGAGKLSEGAASAKEGADQLEAGIGSLKDGAYKLEDGLSPLADGMKKLRQSAEQLQDGAASLSGGLGKLDAAEAQLAKSSAGVDANLAQLAAGLSDEQKRAAGASDEAVQLSEALKKFAGEHPDLASDEALAAIMKSSEQLEADSSASQQAAAQLAKSAAGLSAGHTKLTNSLEAVSSSLAASAKGGSELAAGMSQFNAGLGSWSQGFSAFGAGLHSLADGSAQLNTGAEALAQGFVSLVNGSQELSGQLQDAAAQSAGAGASDEMLNMYAQPIQLVEQPISGVPNYGTGSAPYFLALGLLVGGLMAFNIIPFNFPASPQVGGLKFTFSKMGVFYVISVVQTIIVNALLLFAFGIKPVNLPMMLLYSLLVSLTFMTLIMMLVVLLGTFGKLLGVALVVTQLSSSGGTFPFELAPQWIQAIGRCLPMTYVQRGFHAAISTGEWSVYWKNFGILLAFLAGFIVVMLIRNLMASQSGKLQPKAAGAH